MSRESKRLQKSRNDLSGNALIQHLSEKNAIFVFPVISGGTVKRVLIAYFIVNISAKNIKMRSRVSTLHQTRGVAFLGHSVYTVRTGTWEPSLDASMILELSASAGKTRYIQSDSEQLKTYHWLMQTFVHGVSKKNSQIFLSITQQTLSLIVFSRNIN